MSENKKLKVPHSKKDFSYLSQKEQEKREKKRAADLKYRRERRRLDKLEREQKPPEEWVRKVPEQTKKKNVAIKKATKVRNKPFEKESADQLRTLRGFLGDEKKQSRKKLGELQKLQKEAKRLDRKWNKEIREEEKRREETEYEIVEVGSTFNKKFTTYFDSYNIRINNVFRDPSEIFLDVIKKAIEKSGIQPGDKFRLILQHSDWYKPFSIKLITVPKGELTRRLIEKAIMFAEYKSVPINELLIEVQTTKLPRGAGIKPTTKTTIKNGGKKCIITIKNTDSTCLARAIVTGHANNNPQMWTKSELQDGFNRSRKLQKEEALRLHKNANVEIIKSGNTIEDCDKFAEYLGVCIRVFSGDKDIPNITDHIHESKPKGFDEQPEQQFINLYKEEKLFNLIRSMTAFSGSDYYCDYCAKSYTKKNIHKCPKKCNRCFSYECNDNNETELMCKDCNRLFKRKSCFEEHKRGRRIFKDNLSKPDIVCEKIKKCTKSKRLVGSLIGHICGYSSCNNCKKYCDPKTHKCFMTQKETKGGLCTRKEQYKGQTCPEVITNKKLKKQWCLCCQTHTTKYLFVDFEATQDKIHTNGYKEDHKNTNRKTHEVNYIRTETYSGFKSTYKNIDEFCTDIMNKYDGYTIIAHNGGSYDFKFVQAWFINNGIVPKIIANGSKIMYMTVNPGAFKGTIRFVDSLNFVSSKLSELPKIFGLEEKKKGYFPHFFNTKENQKYVGKIPDKKYYGPGYMKPGDRKKFLKWHKERVQENYVFNMRKEMSDYCESDVDILASGVRKFRKDFIELGNIDPLQYITIAGDCMALYRNKYMPEKTIAVFKDTKEETHSEESIRWLKYIEDKNNVKTQHATNGGEFVVSNDIGKVDGYCKETNTVYEFQGCFWHGCTKCFPDQFQTNPVCNLEMCELRERTTSKNNNIKNLGYNLVETWECDLKKDEDYKTWKENNNIEVVTPLNPRDAFFGGRTNVTKLMYNFKNGESGMYKDFCSLYPTTNVKKTYPVGHPVKLHNPENWNDDWFGLVKCKILPPKELHHPVLPVKTKCGDADKLLFPLCKTCGEKHIQEKCNHTDEERSLIATWCTPEIRIALEKGYKIIKTYEVWHFTETTETLFGDYVRDFAKIKIESSKPPKVGEDCVYKSLDDFREKVWKKDGIRIGEIKHNPGKRQINCKVVPELFVG